MSNCIFCEFGSNKLLIPDQFIAEDGKSFVMLSYTPSTKGSLLIVPKKHFSALSVVPKDLVGLLFNQAIRYGEILKQKLGARAYIIKVNNDLYKLETDRGHIGHIHIHVIPRYKANEKDNPKRASGEALRSVKAELVSDTIQK